MATIQFQGSGGQIITYIVIRIEHLVYKSAALDSTFTLADDSVWKSLTKVKPTSFVLLVQSVMSDNYPIESRF